MACTSLVNVMPWGMPKAPARCFKRCLILHMHFFVCEAKAKAKAKVMVKAMAEIKAYG